MMLKFKLHLLAMHYFCSSNKQLQYVILDMESCLKRVHALEKD